MKEIHQEERAGLWKCRERKIEIGKRTLVMGVLNVTPDSFSDGGRFFRKGAAKDRALAMVEEGADILDVGGESSRPGAAPVSADEEMRRVLPVIEELRNAVDVPLSLDSRKPQVARAALAAGVDIFNDISGLGESDVMARLAAESGAGLVLMHMRGTPETMQKNTVYDSLLDEVRGFLMRRASLAEEVGVTKMQIVVDPGIGFGKSFEGNLLLLRRLREATPPGYPILVGTSRKSFIGRVLRREVEERIWGTAATVALSIAGGADVVRVHDVREMKEVAAMSDAIVRSPSDFSLLATESALKRQL